MKLTIGHLYPDLLNLYGDRGNIQCMMKRCQWRGIDSETIEYTLEDKIDFTKLDIVLLGGGSDREQMLVCDRLRTIQKDFHDYVEDGGSVIAVCGGYQSWDIIMIPMRDESKVFPLLTSIPNREIHV